MLPRKNRLIKKDLPKTLSQGKTFHSEHFSLKITFINRETESKFSFIVSKKIAKLAVSRNLLKRRSKASLIPYLKKIKPGFVGIFYIKKGAKELSFQDFEKEIAFLLEKAEFLK